jgi:hypothetical protein
MTTTETRCGGCGEMNSVCTELRRSTPEREGEIAPCGACGEMGPSGWWCPCQQATYGSEPERTEPAELVDVAGLCPSCSGSGEGRTDGSICWRCGGCGEVPSAVELAARQDAEDARADWAYDAAREDVSCW